MGCKNATEGKNGLMQTVLREFASCVVASSVIGLHDLKCQGNFETFHEILLLFFSNFSLQRIYFYPKRCKIIQLQ